VLWNFAEDSGFHIQENHAKLVDCLGRYLGNILGGRIIVWDVINDVGIGRKMGNI
jgi:hypothetical protein